MKAINETIANAIVESINRNANNEDTFSIEMKMEGALVYINGSFEIDGYCEDDYFNGTGAWVTTYVAVSIDSVEAYDEDGNEAEVICNLAEIERYAENELAA